MVSKRNEEEPQQYTKIHRYFGVIDAIAIVFLHNTKKEKQHYFSFEIWSFSNAYNIHA